MSTAQPVQQGSSSRTTARIAVLAPGIEPVEPHGDLGESVRALSEDESVGALAADLDAAGESAALLIADQGGNPGWIKDVVRPALGGLEAREQPASAHAATWWGTGFAVRVQPAGHFTEVVAYPTDLAALAVRATTGLALRRCGWCDTRIAARERPFCGNAA